MIKPMKVMAEDKVKWDTVEFPVLVSMKYDGVYAYSEYNEETDKVKLLSRVSKPLVADHLLEELKVIHKELGVEHLIGELYIEGQDFDYVSGIVRKKKNFDKDLKESLMFYFHDYVSDETFIDRYKKILETTPQKHIFLVGEAPIFNKTDLDCLFDGLEEEDEGLIVRDIMSPYRENKRCQDLFKMKKKISVTLKIEGYFLGKEGSKYEKTIGGLLCISKDGIKVRVGSGLTDKLREEFLKDFDKVDGKFCEVEAMNKTKTGALRMPRFKGIREDKTKADTLL